MGKILKMENLSPSEKSEPRRRVRRATRHDPDAPDNVGSSVSKPREHKAKQGATVPELTVPNVVSLDAPAEWIEEPTMKDQIRNKDLVKLDRVEAKVYNLGDPKSLEEYNVMLVRTSKENTNCFVVQEDRQFAPALGTFQVFVKLQYVLYRKVLKTKKD